MKQLTGIESSGVSGRRDLFWVCLSTGLFWLFSILVELSERILAMTRQWERYQIDELQGVLLFLAIALSWFGWRRVCEARVELARRVALEKQLAETLAENRRLSLSHVSVQEDERKQLARELHDEMGQHLNAIKIDAVSIRDWSAGVSNDVHTAAVAIISVVNHVQNTIRDMLRRLRPAGLDELGLAAALENLVQQWQSRNPQTHAALDVGNDADGLRENENMTCYRLVQEALNNVTRHAQARNVRVSLQRQQQRLVISVADDGAGAGVHQAGMGLGLVGMRERVESLGGEIRFDTATGKGFCINAAIPLEAA